MDGIISPKSLLEATRLFSTREKAHSYFRDMRWPSGVVPCPECGCTEHYYLASRLVWKCKSCKRQFSVKVGTIFEDSPLGLDKWLIAVWLIANAKNGISSCELARALSVQQRTAWFMNHRIRHAMQNGTFEKLVDHVEADETYVGGVARNMHKGVRERRIDGTGGQGKSVVLGFLERDGDIRTYVVRNNDKKTLQGLTRANFLKGSNLYTDALRSYRGLNQDYRHMVIDHAVSYVEWQIHTNGLENFWSLLKRTMRGTYVSVEPVHLHRYLDEYAFRFNTGRTTTEIASIWSFPVSLERG